MVSASLASYVQDKYNASKVSHNEYQKKLKVWEDKYGSAVSEPAPRDELRKNETPKKVQENVSTPKRQLNIVSLKAELQKKTTIVKERDEHREHKITKAKNRNVEL